MHAVDLKVLQQNVSNVPSYTKSIAKNRISDLALPTHLPISDYIQFSQTYLPTQTSDILYGRPLKTNNIFY